MLVAVEKLYKLILYFLHKTTFLILRMQEYQEETGNLYNLEATPAEGTTHRFAREDQKRYPDILQAGILFPSSPETASGSAE